MSDLSLPVAERTRTVFAFSPQDGISAEDRWHTAFVVGGAWGPDLHFWSQSRCLVTTQAISRRAEFAWASERSLARGWPVTIRRSGGGTVFHGEGVLCVSMLERLPIAQVSVDIAYRRFCAGLAAGLRSLGVLADVGPMSGAPCDGRFNILAGGRKLAGTAARMRFNGDEAHVLMHAALVVDEDTAAGVGAVQRFETDLGLGYAYDVNCMTSIAETIGSVGIEAVAEAVDQHFKSKNFCNDRNDP